MVLFLLFCLIASLAIAQEGDGAELPADDVTPENVDAGNVADDLDDLTTDLDDILEGMS